MGTPWDQVSTHLFDVPVEFFDGQLFSACRRSRGYVHNLPIENRVEVVQLPATVQESFPDKAKFWPPWDSRKVLQCISIRRGTGTDTEVANSICRSYAPFPPPPSEQAKILQIAKKWNLIWTGLDRLSVPDPVELEYLLGYDKDHTRSITTFGDRYSAIGNSFHVPTVSYHLSVLKDKFPEGINVLSLFDGIGGALVALTKAGVKVRTYVGVEIEKVCRRVVEDYWKATGQQGDLIFKEDILEFNMDKLTQYNLTCGGFHLVIGGSPCNNFTGNNRISGSKLQGRSKLAGFDSVLFYEFARIVKDLIQIQRKETID